MPHRRATICRVERSRPAPQPRDASSARRFEQSSEVVRHGHGLDRTDVGAAGVPDRIARGPRPGACDDEAHQLAQDLVRVASPARLGQHCEMRADVGASHRLAQNVGTLHVPPLDSRVRTPPSGPRRSSRPTMHHTGHCAAICPPSLPAGLGAARKYEPSLIDSRVAKPPSGPRRSSLVRPCITQGTAPRSVHRACPPGWARQGGTTIADLPSVGPMFAARPFVRRHAFPGDGGHRSHRPGR